MCVLLFFKTPLFTDFSLILPPFFCQITDKIRVKNTPFFKVFNEKISRHPFSITPNLQNVAVPIVKKLPSDALAVTIEGGINEMPEDGGWRLGLKTSIERTCEIPLFLKFRGDNAQNTPFFRDFAVRDFSQQNTPFPLNLEHTWLPLFMLTWGTGDERSSIH